jgi:hypothetical protein
MIIYNNQEYKTFKELREKCHLVSERETCVLCHCKWKTVRKICEQNNIKKYSVVSNSQECLVYDESIIDLLHSIKPIKNNPIPDNFILQKELTKYLGITAHTLREMMFWCWDFKQYRKIINGKIYYNFSEETKDFYSRKLYKWRHPDRKHGTCWQR